MVTETTRTGRDAIERAETVHLSLQHHNSMWFEVTRYLWPSPSEPYRPTLKQRGAAPLSAARSCLASH